MSYYRDHDRGGNHRPLHSEYQHNGRMYDDDHYEGSNQGRSDFSISHGAGSGGGDDQDRHAREGPQDYGSDGFHIRGRASSPARHARHGYRDRDRADYVSPRRGRWSLSPGARGSRSRSYSRDRRPRTPEFGGPPSKEIMLDGLPYGLREEDIAYQLKTHYDAPELKDIRVIRDRDTKKSRGFGFVRFHNLQDAQRFMEHNHPKIYLDERGSDRQGGQPVRVGLAFSRERDDRNKTGEVEEGWICAGCSTLNFAGRKACFRCYALPVVTQDYPDPHTQRQEYLSSGDSDAAMQGPPSQFLLIRGLEPNVNEELLSRGVSKLLRPSPSAAGSTQPPKKGKVASTTGDANLGAKEGSIRRVFLVRDRQSGESWRYGFAEFSNLEEASAAITRFNSYERFTISSKLVTRFSFSPSGNPSLRLQYWNDKAYVSELVINVSDDGQTAAESTDQRPSTDAAAVAATKEGLLPASDDHDPKIKKRKVESKEREKDAAKAKKTTPAHLQFWSNRHAELHGARNNDATGEDKQGPANSTPDELSAAENVPTQSFADHNKMCCYLCSRQFKSNAEVNKHERLSKLHQSNLHDKTLLKKALAKLEKAGVSTSGGIGEATETEYRDRAKERRQAFGPTKKISLPLKPSAVATTDTNSTIEDHEPAATGNAGNAASVPKSKGAALMGKMGWNSGTGLGARNDGLTQAIETNVYAAGVGLGAEGGKLGDAVEEAARNSRSDYKEFLQKTKDKAKERYQKELN